MKTKLTSWRPRGLTTPSRRSTALGWADRLRTPVRVLRRGGRELPPWAMLLVRLGGYALLAVLILWGLSYAHDVSKDAVDDAVTRFGRFMLMPLALALLIVIGLAVAELLRATVLRRDSWSFDPGTGLGLGDYGAERGRGSRRRRRRR